MTEIEKIFFDYFGYEEPEFTNEITTHIKKLLGEEIKDEFPGDKDNQVFQNKKDAHNQLRATVLRGIE